MIIRREEQKDYSDVYALVKDAFATVEHSDGTEADRVSKNREKSRFVPELALVAEDGGQIVGYIALYEIQIEYIDGTTDTQVEVAPLAVRPDCFKKGIGAALLQAGYDKAKKLGYKAIFLCGHPSYYPRFGYVPTYQYHIYHKRDKTHNAPWCMVKELAPGYLGQKEAIIDIE